MSKEAVPHDNPVVVSETLDEILATINETLSKWGEARAESHELRDLVERAERARLEAISLRNARLRELVANGMTLTGAASELGISRQMARRVLGGVDVETVGRLHGAALPSWSQGLDDETKAALLELLDDKIEGGS